MYTIGDGQELEASGMARICKGVAWLLILSQSLWMSGSVSAVRPGGPSDAGFDANAPAPLKAAVVAPVALEGPSWWPWGSTSAGEIGGAGTSRCAGLPKVLAENDHFARHLTRNRRPRWQSWGRQARPAVIHGTNRMDRYGGKRDHDGNELAHSVPLLERAPARATANVNGDDDGASRKPKRPRPVVVAWVAGAH